VIDSERHLAGLVVDEDTLEALERSEQMTPEHLLLIDASWRCLRHPLKQESTEDHGNQCYNSVL
jgi:hypothetical protein